MAREPDYDPISNYGGDRRDIGVAEPIVLPRQRYTDRVPVIDNFGRAQHDHSSASAGGLLDENSFATDYRDGWLELPATLSAPSGYAKGRRYVELPSSASLAAVLTPGMRMRFERTVDPPTRCADLETSSTHYASRASGSVSGITFTGSYSAEAIIELESYGSGTMTVLSRFGTSGWWFGLLSDGRLRIQGAGAGGSELCDSIESIPLGRKVHVAGVLNPATGTGALYIDGQLVASIYTNGPDTAIVQNGPLQIGAWNGATNPFDGKVMEVRLWNVARTQTEIRDNMHQQLATVPSSCVGYWKLDGDFNDSSANLNHLTAQNSATATTVDHLFQATEYGIVLAVTSTTVTVFTGSAHSIPTSFENVYYSKDDTPYGFPRDKEQWRIVSAMSYLRNAVFASANVWVDTALELAVPPGDWMVGYSGSFQMNITVSGTASVFYVLRSSAPTNAVVNYPLMTRLYQESTTNILNNTLMQEPYSHSAQTIYKLFTAADSGAGAWSWYLRGDQGIIQIFADCAYL